MPPQRTADASSKRGGASGKKAKPPPVRDEESDDPFESSDDQGTTVNAPRKRNDQDMEDAEEVPGRRGEEEDDEEPEKTIPKELLTRLLHEFFAKDATRISRDANATVGKYFDVFVREAIARTAVEKQGGFLEVDDLEKATPQLLLDL